MQTKDDQGSLSALRLHELTYTYHGQQGCTVEKVSFDWHKGESILLIGPSGSGKSTLGKLIKGLLQPDFGAIELTADGKPRGQTSRELMRLVGWCDAQPERQIFAATVAEEVGFGPTNFGFEAGELQERVAGALKAVGLEPDRFLGRDPLSLSGGEKRRVALASIIVLPADFYIFDEPEAGLDEEGIEAISELLVHLKQDCRGTMVITHELEPAICSADRVLAMAEGKIVADQPAGEFDPEVILNWLECGSGADFMAVK